MEHTRSEELDQYEEWIKFKRKEFMKLGYGKIDEKDLWNYLTAYRWKKGHPKRYHQAVSDIMHTSPNDYLNYETLKAQVYDVKPMDQFDLDGLI